MSPSFRLQGIIISLRQTDSSVVVESGRLFVFGDNSYGQLGLGNSKPQTKPSCVKGMSDIVLYFYLLLISFIVGSQQLWLNGL